MVCKLIEEFESRNIAVITMGTDTGLLLVYSLLFLVISVFCVSLQLSAMDQRH
jgi:hypothetical protein